MGLGNNIIVGLSLLDSYQDVVGGKSVVKRNIEGIYFHSFVLDIKNVIR